MNWLLFSLGILIMASVLLLVFFRLRNFCSFLFLGSLLSACLSGMTTSLSVLTSGVMIEWRLSWHVPLGEFYIGLDPLSAFFLLTIVLLSSAAGLYGWRYFQEDSHRKNLAPHYFFFHLLLAANILIVAAKNAILFLMAWETMTMASYFLITFYDEKWSVRKAGYLYLIFAHCATFDFLMFSISNMMNINAVCVDIVVGAIAAGVVGSIIGWVLSKGTVSA